MYKLYQRFWVMDFMISIFFYCICLTVHNSEMYLYKGEHVFVYIYASFLDERNVFLQITGPFFRNELIILLMIRYHYWSIWISSLLFWPPSHSPLISPFLPPCISPSLFASLPSSLLCCIPLFPGHFSPFLPRGKISNMFIMHLCLVFF